MSRLNEIKRLAVAIGNDIKGLQEVMTRLGTAAFKDVGTADGQVMPSDETYSSLAVQSRGMNLVTNGTGLMNNNYNFASFEFYPQDTYVGGGSFLHTGRHSWTTTTDEFIPVIADKYYKVEMSLKAINGDGPRAYIGIVAYDIDKLRIAPYHYTYHAETVTTLVAPLKPQDTVIHLESVNGWRNSEAARRNIKIHRYVNSKGYAWPAATYTRNITRSYTPLYDNDNIDDDDNTILLNTPWDLYNPETNDGSWPAGTVISTYTLAGGRYFYPSNIVGTPIPNKWIKGYGIVGSINKSPLATSNQFPPGTAYIKIGALLNYGGNKTDQTLISGVYFSEITAENIVGDDKKIVTTDLSGRLPVTSITAGNASYNRAWRKLEDKTFSSGSSTITAAHGVTNIAELSVKAVTDAVTYYQNDVRPAYQFTVESDDSNIIIKKGADAVGLDGATVTIYIDEEVS
ncbi:hypothetical protein [Psychrobacter pygoscelis]|uniref:hypothetical protein n=1 Tax=Psychrobacter pygoscelis TaxID=2488563 RepID=UPI00103DC834|nr:hypothetical protein [Psychrobacter pygoscelis]